MRSFTVLCLFGDKRSPFTLWLSDPAADAHPLEQQAAWLWRERGGLIPEDLMNAVANMQSLALEANVPFEEYLEYAEEALANEPDEDTEAPVFGDHYEIGS